MTTVGTLKDAAAIYYQHEHDVTDDRLGWVEPCGAGEDRTVYRVGDIVYKIPTRPSANPYDHHTQEEARRRGYRWAPPASTLWKVRDGVWGVDVDVLAMTYLEDDGTSPDPELMAEMRAQARSRNGGPVDGTNYVVIGGQPIVIDFCTVHLPQDARPTRSDSPAIRPGQPGCPRRAGDRQRPERRGSRRCP